MFDIRIVRDIEECRELWQRHIPPEVVSDLWEVRLCFHRQYQHPPCFIVAEENGQLCGLMPLSRIEDRQILGYFPGETWAGRTWLEQNRLIVRDEAVLEAMLTRCHQPYQLRYLLPLETVPLPRQVVDETGYLFLPPKYHYDMETYFQEFSHKSAKRIRKEIAELAARATFRYDDPADFEHLVNLNLSRFGENSYYYDSRFREGFRSLMHYLRDNGWLRITTVLMDGEPAAVDMGSLYRGAYTMLAGGTHGGYPGVAKLINNRHMEFACEEKLNQVDFLCGNFSWKSMFHLTPRPLYLLSNLPAPDLRPGDTDIRSATHA